MSDKTLEEYKIQEEVDKKLKCERDISNSSYARKLAETLIFGFVGMSLIAVVGALLKYVIK